MKKIAFMFAAAALMVACGNGAKTATKEQKDSIKNAIYAAELEAAKAAIPAPEQLAEGATAEDSAKYDEAVAAYQDQISKVTVDSTTEDFKKKVDAAVAEFEKSLNETADTTKNGEEGK